MKTFKLLFIALIVFLTASTYTAAQTAGDLGSMTCQENQAALNSQEMYISAFAYGFFDGYTEALRLSGAYTWDKNAVSRSALTSRLAMKCAGNPNSSIRNAFISVINDLVRTR